jgi:hypothetical protein
MDPMEMRQEVVRLLVHHRLRKIHIPDISALQKMLQISVLFFLSQSQQMSRALWLALRFLLDFLLRTDYSLTDHRFPCGECSDCQLENRCLERYHQKAHLDHWDHLP